MTVCTHYSGVVFTTIESVHRVFSNDRIVFSPFLYYVFPLFNVFSPFLYYVFPLFSVFSC